MSNSRIVDLTHVLSAETPCWDGRCGFELSVKTDYGDCTDIDLFRVQKLSCSAGVGTHMDAPAHCFPGAATIDAIALNDLITNCVVIDATGGADENYLAMPEAIEEFERSHGRIAPGAFVLFHTGWEERWNSPEQYRNNLRFPAVHENTAKLLLERGIAGLGIDTLSPDARGESFPVHRAILGAGKYIVENVANAGQLPPVGARILVMPMKIFEGTEAPVRLAALV